MKCQALIDLPNHCPKGFLQFSECYVENLCQMCLIQVATFCNNKKWNEKYKIKKKYCTSNDYFESIILEDDLEGQFHLEAMSNGCHVRLTKFLLQSFS